MPVSYTSIFEKMPEIAGSWHIKFGNEKTFSFPLHNHDHMSEFLLIINGEGQFHVDGKLYEGRSGHLLCYNRSVWHEEKSTSSTFHAMYIGFQGLQVKNLPPGFFLERSKSPLIDLNEQFVPIKQLFYEIIMESKSKSPESQVITKHLLGVLMCRLAQLVHYRKDEEFKRNRTQDAVWLAKKYIEENYQSDISLKTLAKLSHINPYHFSHLFKQQTGHSPIQHLIQYRVEVSKHYLMTTQKSIDEISELVGYKSGTYFQNIFKKVTGMSPGRFRCGHSDANRLGF